VRSDTATVAGPPRLTSVNTHHQVARCSMTSVVVLDVEDSNRSLTWEGRSPVGAPLTMSSTFIRRGG
jgi:hypothetical protein